MRRHSLVWLKMPPTNPDGTEAAADWYRSGHPFMVCRTRPGERLSLGYCRPRSPATPGSPSRHTASTHPENVLDISRPPELFAIADRLGLIPKLVTPPPNPNSSFTIRVVGSHMWQAITGLVYTHGKSDLDLVVDLNRASAANEATDFLDELSTSGPKIDAELAFPSGGEVHWQEWKSRSPQLLLKAVDSVRLVDRTFFLEPAS